MKVLNQPWDGRMDDELNALMLQNPKFDKVFIAVAFVKRSGVRRIGPALTSFTQSGSDVEVVAGIDHLGTSRQGLEELQSAGAKVSIFHDNVLNRTFHTKLYLFERSGSEAVVYLGSSNLTAGGLYSNYETNTCYNFNLGNPAELADYQSFKQVFDTAQKLSHRLTPALLADLVQRVWLSDENVGFSVTNTTPGQSAGMSSSVPAPVQSPFPRISVPMAPRLSRILSVTTVSAQQNNVANVAGSVVANALNVQSISTLIINLTYRDISTKGGKSPDIQITKEVRNANQNFWQWPFRFINDECYFPMLINRIGQTSVVTNVRVYANTGISATGKKRSDEFRLNTGLIRTQAQVGDLLQIERMKPGLPYEYELTVIPKNDPLYATLAASCTKISSTLSQKMYRYF